jgi:hypothetical protein
MARFLSFRIAGHVVLLEPLRVSGERGNVARPWHGKYAIATTGAQVHCSLSEISDILYLFNTYGTPREVLNAK